MATQCVCLHGYFFCLSLAPTAVWRNKISDAVTVVPFKGWFAFSDCEIEILPCRSVPRQECGNWLYFGCQYIRSLGYWEKKKSNYQEGGATLDTQESLSQSSDSQLLWAVLTCQSQQCSVPLCTKPTVLLGNSLGSLLLLSRIFCPEFSLKKLDAGAAVSVYWSKWSMMSSCCSHRHRDALTKDVGAKLQHDLTK